MARPKPAYHHGDLRNALVAEALKLMEKAGDYDFSLRDLAGRLGVSYAALYSHFEDKDALLAAISAVGFGRFKDAMEHAEQGETDLRRIFLARGMAYVQFGMDHPALYKLMFMSEELRYKKDKYPELKTAALAALGSLMGMLTRLQEAGLMRKGPVDADSITVFTHMHGLTSLILSGRIEGALDCSGLQKEDEPVTPMDVVRYSLSVLLGGLGIELPAA